ncbi:MAG: DUF3576 domain-containing protein [Alphaproteobacteria bacterium]|nr:DUF3576 domain-containing protein [Alphaproteobacteria bacterium]
MALTAAIVLAATSIATGCASSSDSPRPERDGGGGFLGFGGGDDDRNAGEEGIGVNSFLWRASLDTLRFMPLASEDPFGGVIITDWYVDPTRPNERFKATVYILDTRLRADAVTVSLFRQTRNGAAWQDAAVSPDTTIQLENQILRRARELRLSTLRN